MHYTPVLDSISEEHLVAEIERRKRLRANGLCDYCERSPDTTPCRYPERHKRRSKGMKWKVSYKGTVVSCSSLSEARKRAKEMIR